MALDLSQDLRDRVVVATRMGPHRLTPHAHAQNRKILSNLINF